MTAKTVSTETARNALLGVGLVGILGVFAAFAVPVLSPTPPVQPAIVVPAEPVPVQPVPVTPTPAQVTAPNVAPAPAATPAATPAPYRIDRFIARPDKFQHGDYIWNDDGVPAGPMLVTVDVATQLIHVFRSGREIGTAVILYGADDSPTPLGSFPIMDKDAHHVSSIFGAPMPYNLRLTGDGVAVHGSSHMRYGWATNGCIGVPVPFAKLLFGQVKVGDRVIISRGGTPKVGDLVPLS
jgi:lipoprotein-anchoring transpeptidase ErfK/SrfK